MNYSLTDGGRSPYAASLLGNLRHWLADDPDILDLIEKSERHPAGGPLRHAWLIQYIVISKYIVKIQTAE